MYTGQTRATRGNTRRKPWRWPRKKLSLLAGAAALLLSTPVGAEELQRETENGLPTQAIAEMTACSDGVSVIGFSDELDKTSFSGFDVGGLSGLVSTGQGDSYYAVTDHEDGADARYYELSIPVDDDGLGTLETLAATALLDRSGQPYDATNFDGEALALTSDGILLVASETEPSIRLFDADGRWAGELLVPARFLVAPNGQAQANASFESLALTPSERRLYTATELPLADDGSDAEGRHRIRILQYMRVPYLAYLPRAELYYLTEPGQRVVDMLAVDDGTLLVLEKGVANGSGDTIRVFKVSLAGATNVSSDDSLESTAAEPLEKTLLVDIGADCMAPEGEEVDSLVENYDGMAFGPRLASGYRSLILVSDDNFSSSQVTRVLALAVDDAVLQ